MTILTFDTETTGVDVHNDRIVTAFLGLMDDSGNWIRSAEWLLNIGRDIAPGATAVHGITNEHMRAHGRMDLAAALTEIRDIIHEEALHRDSPLVIYNAPFDLTLLNAELARHSLAPLNISNIHVIDPYVIDKHRNQYRKGKRTLTVIAPYYGVPVETNAHDAGADCLMTGRIALKQLLASGTNPPTNSQQARWKAEQSISLEKYLCKADPTVVVNQGWPLQV